MNDEVLEPKRHPRTKQSTIVSLAIVAFIALAVNLAHTKVTADNSQQGRDEVRLALSGNGFAPTEFQHGPGTFAISVENESLPGEYTLRLKAEDGTILKEFQIQKGSSAWTVNLPTGRYELTEVNHPQWTCRIVVQ